MEIEGDCIYPRKGGLVIMHLCNNHECINLAHLKLGTQSENIRQMYDEDRSPRQSLSRQEKLEIIEAYATGEYTQDQLGALYAVNRRTISYVVNRYKRQRGTGG